ncbi:MAG TPA: 3-phosphoshikimate 1-carboxyvinyltransferase [Candidatus Baltobacteraceae bacterium]|nr:3-phosphoshikimate 1-carboxyvinyltransferase [Candidatus Baltobacteraceae bacterium]
MSSLKLRSRSFEPGPLRGTISVPGDKSVSHRALMLAAAAAQPVEIRRLNPGRDVRATMEALIALGARVEHATDAVTIGARSLHEPMGPLDCMNSGSTARMMLGVCAGADVPATFDGDESLRRRPMEPVAAQLRAFGAKIETTGGKLPVRFEGTPRIETQRFILLSPSAQVKSALLLAGLFSKTPVTIFEDRGSRDHTERLLTYLGADVTWDGKTIELRSGITQANPIAVCGDFSAAAFFIVAATVAPGSELTITDVGVNPTRTGLLDALLAMGAAIELRNPREQSGEPVADLFVHHAPLHGTTIGPDVALRAIDEIPVLAVAAAFAQGETKITGVRELRTKESDRLAAIERLLSAVEIAVEVATNGLVIRGARPRATGADIDTHDDHRIAMAAATLATGAGPLRIDSDASIDVSFPSFLETLGSVQRT